MEREISGCRIRGISFSQGIHPQEEPPDINSTVVSIIGKIYTDIVNSVYLCNCICNLYSNHL